MAYTLTQNYGVDLILPELMLDEFNGGDEADSDPLFEMMPPTYEDADQIRYEQWENGYGLLNTRGLGGGLQTVDMPGFRQYLVNPGYYGERVVLGEVEMTKSRAPGSPNEVFDPKQRIAMMQQYQAQKTVNRMRQTLVDFLSTGTFRNKSADGAVVHTDTISGYSTIAVNTTTLSRTGQTTGAGWAASPSTADPLNDLRLIKLELEFGTSSKFGPDSTILCHPNVVIDILNTTTVKSTMKNDYGSSYNDPSKLDDLLLKNGLPKLRPYGYGYFPTLSDAIYRTYANYTRFFPTKTMIWLGKRPKGQKLGKFILTRNLGTSPPSGVGENPFSVPMSGDIKQAWSKGLYVNLYYNNKAPWQYELDLVLHGGPVVHFPSAAAGISYS